MLHHLTLVIILNQDDYDFDSDDETPLSNLVKDNSSNNKNDNLNSLQSNKKRKSQREYRWSSMKDRTSITQNINFSDNRMSDNEK